MPPHSVSSRSVMRPFFGDRSWIKLLTASATAAAWAMVYGWPLSSSDFISSRPSAEGAHPNPWIDVRPFDDDCNAVEVLAEQSLEITGQVAEQSRFYFDAVVRPRAPQMGVEEGLSVKRREAAREREATRVRILGCGKVQTFERFEQLHGA